MNTKFATALIVAASAFGATSSFAYGTTNDNGVWSAGQGSAVALNPNGDVVTSPMFQPRASRSEIGSAVAAQNRAVPVAVAVNPQGPTVVAQPSFRAEQSRAQVRRDVAQGREVVPAIALNPNGDDALPRSVAQRRVTPLQRTARAVDAAAQSVAE